MTNPNLYTDPSLLVLKKPLLLSREVSAPIPAEDHQESDLYLKGYYFSDGNDINYKPEDGQTRHVAEFLIPDPDVIQVGGMLDYEAARLSMAKSGDKIGGTALGRVLDLVYKREEGFNSRRAPLNLQNLEYLPGARTCGWPSSASVPAAVTAA